MTVLRITVTVTTFTPSTVVIVVRKIVDHQQAK